MAEKSWRNYLSDSYSPEDDLQPELNPAKWSWGSLGPANQQKFRTQRAVLLGHFSYFLLESDNIRGGLDSAKIGWLYPAYLDYATPILAWKSTEDAKLATSLANLDAQILTSPASSSPTIKAEKPVAQPSVGAGTLSTTFQEKIQLERFNAARDAVPVFTRVYDTAVVTAWVKAILTVFEDPLADFWFRGLPDKITFIHNKTDASCQEWLNGLPAPTSAKDLIETVRAAH